jgi:hypothetical protein
MSRSRPGILRRREPLQVGFLPVSDCAPLVQAHEAGLFAKYDLEVELRRESSWASLRDRVVDGELDAAHAPATLPFLTNMGLETEQCECVAGMVLSLQGSAITVSQQLWDSGVRDAVTMREQIYRVWGKRTYTFGIVFPFSTQYFLLREWLKSGGIVPHVEIRMVVVPPTQMFPTLKLGYIDGYCVEEPWNSIAVQAGVGACVATSAELAPLHPEKVLMVRQSLSQPRYVNAPAECLEAGFAGPFESGGRRVENPQDLSLFHRRHANEPTDKKAAWITSHLQDYTEQSSLLRQSEARAPLSANVFRHDIFKRAKALVDERSKKNGPESEPFETHART